MLATYQYTPPSRIVIDASDEARILGYRTLGVSLFDTRGTSSDNSSNRLGANSRVRMPKPVRLPARPGETRDQACRDRVLAAGEDDRDRRGRVFAADKIRDQWRQPIISPLHPAIFDRHVMSLDPAGFVQSLSPRAPEGDRSPRSGRRLERGYISCRLLGRGAEEEADHRHRLLLRAQRAPRGQQAAQQENQLATLIRLHRHRPQAAR